MTSNTESEQVFLTKDSEDRHNRTQELLAPYQEQVQTKSWGWFWKSQFPEQAFLDQLSSVTFWGEDSVSVGEKV